MSEKLHRSWDALANFQNSGSFEKLESSIVPLFKDAREILAKIKIEFVDTHSLLPVYAKGGRMAELINELKKVIEAIYLHIDSTCKVNDFRDSYTLRAQLENYYYIRHIKCEPVGKWDRQENSLPIAQQALITFFAIQSLKTIHVRMQAFKTVFEQKDGVTTSKMENLYNYLHSLLQEDGILSKDNIGFYFNTSDSIKDCYCTLAECIFESRTVFVNSDTRLNPASMEKKKLARDKKIKIQEPELQNIRDRLALVGLKLDWTISPKLTELKVKNSFFDGDRYREAIDVVYRVERGDASLLNVVLALIEEIQKIGKSELGYNLVKPILTPLQILGMKGLSNEKKIELLNRNTELSGGVQRDRYTPAQVAIAPSLLFMLKTLRDCLRPNKVDSFHREPVLWEFRSLLLSWNRDDETSE